MIKIVLSGFECELTERLYFLIIDFLGYQYKN